MELPRKLFTVAGTCIKNDAPKFVVRVSCDMSAVIQGVVGKRTLAFGAAGAGVLRQPAALASASTAQDLQKDFVYLHFVRLAALIFQ